MNLSIGSEIKQSRRFELVMHVRDSQGNITGRKKSIETDSAQDLESFFVRNSVVKKKKKKVAAAKTAEEINEAVKEMKNYTTKKKKSNNAPTKNI